MLLFRYVVFANTVTAVLVSEHEVTMNCLRTNQERKKVYYETVSRLGRVSAHPESKQSDDKPTRARGCKLHVSLDDFVKQFSLFMFSTMFLTGFQTVYAIHSNW